MPRKPHPESPLLLTVADAPALPNGMATVFRAFDAQGHPLGLATPDERGYLRVLDHERRFVEAEDQHVEVYDP